MNARSFLSGLASSLLSEKLQLDRILAKLLLLIRDLREDRDGEPAFEGSGTEKDTLLFVSVLNKRLITACMI